MQVTCQRCGTTNEFHVIESGPHLKAICDNCGRYIKFVYKNLITNKNEKMNQPTPWGAPAPQPTVQKQESPLLPMRLFPPHPNAPEWVLASGVISMEEFFNFVQANPQLLTEYEGKAQIKFQIKQSKQGKLYAQVDEFKPQPAQRPAARTWGGNTASPSTQEPLDNLPF